MIRMPLLSAAALCAALPAAALDLPGAVELVARTYPGRVVAAQVDASGGESLHYHVDMVLPNSRVAHFDVDGASGRIFNRLPAEEAPQAIPTLQDAMKKVQASTQGRAVAAEFDPDPSPHYHVNVRLAGGKLARYDIDASTQAVSPHAPR
jgi:uncharacterized membrane protein YkoI